MKRRISKMIILGIKQFSEPYYQGFAAQISFYMILSIVPTMVVLSQLLGLLDISLNFLEGWIEQYVSSDMADTLKPLINYSPAVTSNIVMVVMALWAASRAQFSLMRIANYTYTDGKSTGVFWRERLRSMKIMIIILFTIAFVAIILVYGQMILKAVFGQIIEGSIIDTLWTYMRWPLTATLYFLVVSYTYYVLPKKKLKFREILPGSIMGSIGMFVVTVFYSAYTNYVVNYDIIYGSLASIVAILFWFYFLAWVLCLGILFNKVWRDTKDMEGGDYIAD